LSKFPPAVAGGVAVEEHGGFEIDETNPPGQGRTEDGGRRKEGRGLCEIDETKPPRFLLSLLKALADKR
jgi:hypothetical protein